ncbi:preprotein translocase subunit SecA [Jannaschia formosa]|uniref:preprotein translocase subunit SecA n=1 Tax=Jannaschia formosa TaxID=2259592 RepID=UPI000E1BC3F4|nr:prepilin peptidase [Jannaschia formosa]TFL17280.1 prepilin peptidase [Jannaschia formosa]
MTAAAFEARPGPVTGRYPERRWEPMPVLDLIAQDAAGVLRQHVSARAASYRRRARRILALAPVMERLSDEALQASAAELSAALHRHGFRPDLVGRAFALLREVSARMLGKRHFPVQLMGGLAMLDGRIAEMATGEGKSLTATLAAGTAALAGVPVHVITVNDYLVARDAAEMAPLFAFLGLTTAYVAPEMDEAEKRAGYAADVCYVSNKQVVFDYLRDRLAREGGAGESRMMLRGLCFGIVDEADSVLIDEARTPLVIAEKAGGNEAQATAFREALGFARALEGGRDYILREEERSVEFTDTGRRRMEGFGHAAGGIWRGRLRREELVGKALTALLVFHRDYHYIVRDDKVHIVDEFTGRLMSDRSWEQGLHQLIETKEGVTLTDGQVTRAKISYQAFFRRYMHLGGMTGTARDVRGELWAVYRLGVVPIPTNRRSRRRTSRDRVHRTEALKWRAVVRRARAAVEAGRAVLIGTRSVAASDAVSAALTEAGLAHHVLSARQDVEEATVVAQAGQAGRITVATNMAGRGTDIHLDDAVRAAGGLHVIMTERHESRRIDRQLAGRAGRQGDPGRVEVHLSLEDDLLRRYLPDAAAGLRGPLARRLIGPGLIRTAQKRAERVDARARRAVLRSDEKLADFLAFAGRAP